MLDPKFASKTNCLHAYLPRSGPINFAFFQFCPPIYLFIFHIFIGLFGMYRITKRPYKDNPESVYTPLPRNITPLGIELDPSIESQK